VVPDAASRITTSLRVGTIAFRSRAPWAALSSAPSTASNIASRPPASTPMARALGHENVGKSSTLSSTPSRPEVPAPT
jgi:hypothetical protein